MIQFTSITQNADDDWVFDWADTGGPYRVILNGMEIESVPTPPYAWGFGRYPNYPPPLEVVGPGETATTELFSSFLTAQWYAAPDAFTYVAEENYLGGLTPLGAHDEGRWVYTQRGLQHTDGSLVEIIITPYDEVGDAGVPLEFEKTIITAPSSPDADIVIGYNNPQIQITAV